MSKKRVSAKRRLPAGAARLPLPQVLATAVGLHRDGSLTQAETLYRQILASIPDQPDALHFLGMLLYKRDGSEEGVAMMRRSVEINPDHPDFQNNLGNVHVEREQLQDALACYQRATAINPDFSPSLHNLGALYLRLGREEDAMDAYCRALKINPDWSRGRLAFGYMLAERGRKAEAETVFRNWISVEPDNPVPRHYLSALTGEAPDRAADDFVAKTFDSFAGSFEGKLARLGYRAPAIVGEALAAARPVQSADLRILDIGCGTGLCAPLLAPWSCHLTGVDLSARMLDQAREKGLYQELAEAELTAFLQGRRAEYDVLVSADTLCYLGDLEPVSLAARHALKDGRGLFIFTVEAITGTDSSTYRLNFSGRYSHSRDYLQDVLARAGFQSVTIKEEPLRNEFCRPVVGYVVTAGLAPGGAPN